MTMPLGTMVSLSVAESHSPKPVYACVSMVDYINVSSIDIALHSWYAMNSQRIAAVAIPNAICMKRRAGLPLCSVTELKRGCRVKAAPTPSTV